MNAVVPANTASKGMLVNLATRFDMDPVEFRTTIAHTVMPPETTEAEFMAFLMVCNTYTLNPILREIFAFPKKGGGIVPIVSVDGWIRIVNQHPKFKGAEWEAHFDAKENLTAYTCRIYRTDRDMPIVVTEYLSECVRDTAPWKMRHRMLRHKAFIQCSRYAFGFSGIYDEDEGSVIAETRSENRERGKALPIPPSAGGGKDTFDGKGAIEDATVTEVVDAETGEITQQQDEQKPQETKPAEAKADAPQRKRKPNGWPALFEAAKLVIEDGVFTKDVSDPESVGNQAQEGDYADADLILTNGVITKQPGSEPAFDVDAAMSKFKRDFEAADSIDALHAARDANKEPYLKLKAMNLQVPANNLFREAEARIMEADRLAAAEEQAATADAGEADDEGFPGDPGYKAPAGKVDNTTAVNQPLKAAETKADAPEGDPTDPNEMGAAQYEAYARHYLTTSTDLDVLKKTWYGEDAIRTKLGLSEALRKQLRGLFNEQMANIRGE